MVFYQENSVLTSITQLPNQTPSDAKELSQEEAQSKYEEMIEQADTFYHESREAFKKECGYYPDANMTKFDVKVAEFATKYGIS